MKVEFLGYEIVNNSTIIDYIKTNKLPFKTLSKIMVHSVLRSYYEFIIAGSKPFEMKDRMIATQESIILSSKISKKLNYDLHSVNSILSALYWLVRDGKFETKFLKPSIEQAKSFIQYSDKTISDSIKETWKATTGGVKDAVEFTTGQAGGLLKNLTIPLIAAAGIYLIYMTKGKK